MATNTNEQDLAKARSMAESCGLPAYLDNEPAVLELVLQCMASCLAQGRIEGMNHTLDLLEKEASA